MAAQGGSRRSRPAGQKARRKGRRRKKANPYADLPARTRRTVTYVSALVGAVCLVAAVLVLSHTTYSIGMSPNNEVYRTGTVTVSGCSSWDGQWGMYQCRATVESWNDDVRPGAELSTAHEVSVVSRTPLTGRVQVASRLAPLGGDSGNAQGEVIMPLDQAPAGYGVKVLIVLACLAVAVAGTVVAAKIGWPLALRRHRARAGRPAGAGQ